MNLDPNWMVYLERISLLGVQLTKSHRIMVAIVYTGI